MKIVSIILTVLVAASVMAGGNADNSGKTKLTVLNYTDLTVANTVKYEKWQWNTFLKDNPDVYLEKEDLFNEPFHEKSAAYAASGKIPDVLYVWPAGRSTPLHEKKMLKDLMPLIQKDNLQSKFLPIILDPNLQASNYVAMLPQAMTATHALFVNTKLLADNGLKPATSYADLKAQVPILKAKGIATVIMPCKDTWVMQSCMFSMVAGRFCGENWDKRILSGQAKFTDPDFVASLNFIRQLYVDGVLGPETLGIDYGEGPGMFATGKGAYYIDGDWRVGDFLEDEDTGKALIPTKGKAGVLTQNDIQITVFPDIPGAKINKTNSTVLGTGWGISAAIPAGSPQEDAAWRLVKWLCGVENLTRMLQTGGIATPARTDIDYSKLKLAPLGVKVGNLGKEYTIATCVIDDVFHADVYEPINDVLVELGLGNVTAADGAATIQKAYDAWKASN